MSITSEFLTEGTANHPVMKMAVNGQVGIPDLLAKYEQTLDNECFTPNMNSIWDLTNIDITKVEIDDLRKLPVLLKQYEKRRGQEYKVALVTPRSVDFHLLRIYLGILNLIGDHVRVRVFHSLAEAEDWVTV